MVIGIDIRVLTRGTRTGIEEYTLNLLSCLLAQNKNVKFKLFYNAFHKTQLNYEWAKLPNVEITEYRIPNRFLFLSARYLNQPKIDHLLSGVDLFFNPHFFITPLSKECHYAITFHDLSFEYYPELFSTRKRYWQYFLMNIKKEAKRADKLIVVSKSTKEDIMGLYGIPENKIRLIYSGINSKFRKIKIKDEDKLNLNKKYCLPEKFILYFGTLEPRKNLIGLIKAYEIFRLNYKSASDYKLVIAGAPGWLYQKIYKTAKKSIFSNDIIFTGYIEEKDKLYLYNLASLFVYPSFFEGFGFPPLEAMACGIPVITSNISSLPEVVGDAGIIIDPYNLNDLAFAIKETIYDINLRNYLISRGFEQVNKFSWERCAEKTMNFLLEQK